MKHNIPGYMGQILRVDLTKGTTTTEDLPTVDILRQYVGGTGLGIKFLYEEVPPGITPYNEENRIIFASGPLGGTIHATGTFSVVTKGPMTNGALSSQANGFMGAYMKSSGFDAMIIHGKSPKPVYLYLNDGQTELRDASHLWGKDTRETEDLVVQGVGQIA